VLQDKGGIMFSMRRSVYILFALLTFCITGSYFTVQAANRALLAVSPLSADSMQVSVLDGDPNATVSLHYVSGSSMASINIGSTDSYGNLTTTVRSGTYHILGDVQVYAIVNGQQSTATTWPNYANSGNLTLNPAGLALSAGQVATVTTSAGSDISVVDNPSPSVASLTINNNQITVTGNSNGSTNIILCSTNIGCNTLYVSVGPQSNQTSVSLSFNQSNPSIGIGQTQVITVNGPGGYFISNNSNQNVVSANIDGTSVNIKGLSPGNSTVTVCVTNSNVCNYLNITVTSSVSLGQPAISFSQGSTTLNIGQSQTITISGSGLYGISNNSSIGVAVADVSGSTLNIRAVSLGNSSISVCAIGDGASTVCGAISVSVVQPLNQTASSTIQNISFSQTSVTLNVGQNQTVSISGNGGYYMSQNSGQGSISANVSGNTLYISGLAPGGSNITVCQNSTQCGAIYAYVPSPSLYNTSSLPVSSSRMSSSTSPYAFNRYLYMGMTKLGVSDSDVTALQQRLKSDGVYLGPVTGYFGPQTKVGVQAYQKKYGLTQIGVVGPSTRVILNQGK
jgi:hypothetical protein